MCSTAVVLTLNSELILCIFKTALGCKHILYSKPLGICLFHVAKLIYHLHLNEHLMSDNLNCLSR